jgi:hypothetical protein
MSYFNQVIFHFIALIAIIYLHFSNLVDLEFVSFIVRNFYFSLLYLLFQAKCGGRSLCNRRFIWDCSYWFVDLSFDSCSWWCSYYWLWLSLVLIDFLSILLNVICCHWFAWYRFSLTINHVSLSRLACFGLLLRLNWLSGVLAIDESTSRLSQKLINRFNLFITLSNLGLLNRCALCLSLVQAVP